MYKLAAKTKAKDKGRVFISWIIINIIIIIIISITTIIHFTDELNRIIIALISVLGSCKKTMNLKNALRLYN